MDTARVSIDAPADDVYDLVADIANMGRWSPETYKTAWLDGATSAVPGAKFKGWNRLKVGPIPAQWSTTAVVQEADRGKAFTFEVPYSGTRWSYRFEPTDTGCEVTETRELTNKTIAGRVMTGALGWLRTPQIVAGMQTTLDRLKAAAES